VFAQPASYDVDSAGNFSVKFSVTMAGSRGPSVNVWVLQAVSQTANVFATGNRPALGTLMQDCWLFSTAPTPQVDQGADFFVATTAWARPADGAGNPGPIGNVNIVIRCAPQILLYAALNPGVVMANVPGGNLGAVAYLASSTAGGRLPTTGSGSLQPPQYPLPPGPSANDNEDLGGLGGGVSIVPNGPVASLSPISMLDMLILEMAPPGTCSVAGEFQPSAVFDSLSLTLLQAARSARGPSFSTFNFLPQPVPLTNFLTLVADDGATVTLRVGQPQILSDLPSLNLAPPPPPLGPVQALPPRTCPTASQVVQSVCAQDGFYACNTISSVEPAPGTTCLGYFTTSESAGGVAGSLGQYCARTCSGSTDPSTGSACRTLVSTRCSGPDADDLPECSCVRMATSKVPANVIAGQPTTYPQFLRWFRSNFQGGGVPQLLDKIQCWWPPCQGVNQALSYYQPCPSDITTCFTLVEKVTATNGAKVRINLANACGVTAADDTPTQTGQGGKKYSPPAPVPASSQILPLVVVAVVGFLIFVSIWVAWGGSARRIRTAKLVAQAAEGL
jgi:hypothetical protein